MPDNHASDTADGIWVFGYGSLIWRPDFEFHDRRPARLSGWTRRFWQGSHDHRGTPTDPGRVVTLIPEAACTCDGMAYRVPTDVAVRVFDALDHREKNGYGRHDAELHFTDRSSVWGVVYIAPVDNHAFLGAAPIDEIATQIINAHGPSGRNVDYLLQLASSLRSLDAQDAHVFELEARVRELSP